MMATITIGDALNTIMTGLASVRLACKEVCGGVFVWCAKHGKVQLCAGAVPFTGGDHFLHWL
jgi:hypothetical protein